VKDCVSSALACLPIYAIKWVLPPSRFANTALEQKQTFSTLDVPFSTLDVPFSTLDMPFSTLDVPFSTLDINNSLICCSIFYLACIKVAFLVHRYEPSQVNIRFKIFLGNMYIIKDELGHFKENVAKIIQIFFSKRLCRDSDPLKLFLIRPGQKSPDPQHYKKGQYRWYLPLIITLG
jgi:hypothetical protein